MERIPFNEWANMTVKYSARGQQQVMWDGHDDWARCYYCFCLQAPACLCTHMIHSKFTGKWTCQKQGFSAVLQNSPPPPKKKEEKIPVCMCAVISFTVNTCYILSESAGDKESDWLRISHLVSWCFEPSQPQRIISGLKTNFSLSPSPSHSTSHITRLFLLAMDNASHQC